LKSAYFKKHVSIDFKNDIGMNKFLIAICQPFIRGVLLPGALNLISLILVI